MTGRTLRALAWLHWRLTINAVRSGRSRGALEGFSRVAAAVAPVFLAILVIPAMLGITVAGAVGGWALGARPGALPAVVFIVGIALLAPFGWALIRPFAMITQGHLERGELLRLLPIPASLLRHLELMKALLDPFFLVFAPGVLALAPGALLGGRPLVAAVALGGGVGFLALLTCLTGLLSLGTQLVLRDRRRGELVALVFVLVLSTMGFLPQLLRLDDARSHPVPPPTVAEGAPRQAHEGPPELDEVPLGLRVLPSFQLGQALAGAARGQLGTTVLPLGTLWALAVLAYGLSVPLHRRLLETPASGSARREERVDVGRSAIPLVSGPVAAVAVVQLRAYLRSVRGKATVAFPPFIGLLVALTLTRTGTDLPAFFTSATWAPAFVVLMAVFNLGVLACNQFAASGTGLLLELLQPVGERAMVRGRALATSLLCVISVLVSMTPVLVVLPRAALPMGLAIMLAGFAVHLTLVPVMALLSAFLPKTANLSRMGKEGQPHPAAHLIALGFHAVAALPPAGCILVAFRVFETPWLAPLLTIAWVALAAALAVAALPLAERALIARRENLALVAVGR